MGVRKQKELQIEALGQRVMTFGDRGAWHVCVPVLLSDGRWAECEVSLSKYSTFMPLRFRDKARTARDEIQLAMANGETIFIWESLPVVGKRPMPSIPQIIEINPTEFGEFPKPKTSTVWKRRKAA